MPTLLIVDDNAELAGLLAAAATQKGFTVRVAHSGKEATAALEPTLPEAALIDLALPDIGGKTLLKQVRARGVATFAISGVFKGRQVARAALETCGARAFFEKPVDVLEVIARIAVLLAEPAPPPPAPPAPAPAAPRDELDWSELDGDRFPETHAPEAAAEDDFDVDVEVDDEAFLDVDVGAAARRAVPPPVPDDVDGEPAACWNDPHPTPIASPEASLLAHAREDDLDRTTLVPRAAPEASKGVEIEIAPEPRPFDEPSPFDDRPTPVYPLRRGAPLPALEDLEPLNQPTPGYPLGRDAKLELPTTPPATPAALELPTVEALLAGPVSLVPGAVARLLAALARRRATGELRIRRGKVVKVVALSEGSIVFAASNVAGERLSLFALKAGRVPRERLPALKDELRKGVRTGEALVALGLVDEAGRLDLVTRLVRGIVWSVLDAGDGKVEFLGSAPQRKGLLPLSLSAPQLLVDGYRAFPLTRLRALCDRERNYAQVREQPWTPQELGLTTGAAALLAAADGSKSVDDLVLLSELGEREALAALVGFTHLGLVEARAPGGRPVVLV